ncbi:RNA-directed DNA polymerase, eukaryota, reverse transcriptase zinc-binding domain protein [Tanacetum coccineum]
MRFRIRDGKSISVWHDKWNSGTSLSNNISKKEIFYAGFNDQDKLIDILDGSGWKWPQDWLITYPWLRNIKAPILSNTPNMPVWVDNNGNDRKFSTNIVWKDVRGNSDKVCWYNLVWHSNYIPKHTFILWLVVKKKLSTQDWMAKWFPNKNFECSLCKKEPDSHDHLFFNCDYAQKVWKKVSYNANLKIKENKWENILKEMSKEKGKNNIWVVIRKLCFAANVYYILQERNMRLFNNSRREANELVDMLFEEIRAKMMSITFKNNDSVIQV